MKIFNIKLTKTALALTTIVASSSVLASSVGGGGVFGDTAFINDKVPSSFSSISHNDNRETSLTGTTKTLQGLIVGAEIDYDWSSNGGFNKTTIGVAYRYNLNENFYVMPMASYKFQDLDSQYEYQAPTIPSQPIAGNTELGEVKYSQGDSYELGIQAGYHFDNGVFFAAKYGYENSDDNFSMLENGDEINPLNAGVGFDESVSIHDVELTAGYQVANFLMVSASWQQSNFSDVSGYYDDGEPVKDPRAITTTKFKGSNSDIKLKAAYLGAGPLVPFVSYTFAGDQTIKMSNIPFDIKGKGNDEFKIGLSYAF